MKKVVDFNRKMFEFRKVFNKLDNKEYDLLVRALTIPGVDLLVYRWKKLNE